MTEKSTNLQPTGLRSLRAYQLAKQLSHLIYDLTADFPKSEYRLVGQIRGAAISVFGNIAEGYGRNALGDYIRFCEIARGSLSELGTYIEFCHERHFLEAHDQKALFDQYNHTWNTLGALIKALKHKKIDGSWDNTYKGIEEKGGTYDL